MTVSYIYSCQSSKKAESLKINCTFADNKNNFCSDFSRRINCRIQRATVVR